MDNRHNLLIKLEALQRLIMLNTLSGMLALYIETEYPKSGGSWLSSMLSEYLVVPFSRNKCSPEGLQKSFNNYYSHEMMKLGYVKNDSWIDSLKE